MWACCYSGGLGINNVVLNFCTPFRDLVRATMDVIWVIVFFNVFVFARCGDDGTVSDEVKMQMTSEASEPKSYEIELFPPKPTYAGQTRMPRTLFKKLHSGAAFLAGLKLGTILSKKGFELGHGKIASTHSFQIFGKSVNSAMSLSYGNNVGGSLLPVVDDEQSDPSKRTAFEKEEKKVYQVTVIENPANETVEIVEGAPLQEGEKKDRGAEDDNLVMLYQDSINEEPESNFLQEHNRRVKEFNDSIMRRNSKF